MVAYGRFDCKTKYCQFLILLETNKNDLRRSKCICCWKNPKLKYYEEFRVNPAGTWHMLRLILTLTTSASFNHFSRVWSYKIWTNINISEHMTIFPHIKAIRKGILYPQGINKRFLFTDFHVPWKRNPLLLSKHRLPFFCLFVFLRMANLLQQLNWKKNTNTNTQNNWYFRI